jgi:hypothetical protein
MASKRQWHLVRFRRTETVTMEIEVEANNPTDARQIVGNHDFDNSLAEEVNDGSLEWTVTEVEVVDTEDAARERLRAAFPNQRTEASDV